MTETERALRAATEQIVRIIGPAIGSLAVVRGDLEREGEPLDQSDGYEFGKDAAGAMLGEGTCAEDWCDEAREVIAILLPLFQQGVEQAYREKETSVVRHMKGGWPDGCMCGPCETVREAVNQAVAGAYAAAAKLYRELHPCTRWCQCKTLEPTSDKYCSPCEMAREFLALTPADALDKPPSMDDIENCSEAEYKLTADARQASQQGWRCFFCDEVFTDKALAKEHFGSDEHEVTIPACVDPLRIDEKKRHAEVHAMRQEIKRVEGERDEFEIDSDNLHAMQNELERLFGNGVTTAHHAWLRLEAAQNLAEAYRKKLDTSAAAIASAEARAQTLLKALEKIRNLTGETRTEDYAAGIIADYEAAARTPDRRGEGKS